MAWSASRFAAVSACTIKPWSMKRLNSNAVGDTEQAQRVLDHIRAFTDEEGVAEIAGFAPRFPGRKRHLGARRAMEVDLRHYANERDAGESEQNKGLLDLGWME